MSSNKAEYLFVDDKILLIVTDALRDNRFSMRDKKILNGFKPHSYILFIRFRVYALMLHVGN